VHDESAEKPSIVPFPRFFAVLGYALLSLLVMTVLLEALSYFLLAFNRSYRHSRLRRLQGDSPGNLYVCRGTGGAGCPLFTDPDYNIGSASPAYNGFPWAEDFWKEYRAYTSLEESPPPYEPFRLWGLVSFHGQYINNDDTELGRVRRTSNKLPPAAARSTPLRSGFSAGQPPGEKAFRILPRSLRIFRKSSTYKAARVWRCPTWELTRTPPTWN
jgi:hypothetical protein